MTTSTNRVPALLLAVAALAINGCAPNAGTGTAGAAGAAGATVPGLASLPSTGSVIRSSAPGTITPKVQTTPPVVPPAKTTTQPPPPAPAPAPAPVPPVDPNAVTLFGNPFDPVTGWIPSTPPLFPETRFPVADSYTTVRGPASEVAKPVVPPPAAEAPAPVCDPGSCGDFPPPSEAELAEARCTGGSCE